MYPILFEGDYKEKVWGGNKIRTLYNKNIKEVNIGESWEVAFHNHGDSTIRNGKYKGMTLKEMLLKDGERIVGKPFLPVDKFPLLIKIIDAKSNLSVQVHPDDTYAALHEAGELGKSEAWVILDAELGAELIIGLKDGVTKELFLQAVEDKSVEDVLNTLPVQAGDVINIPAGLVHAINAGIVLAEVQQNSDTTYRVFDWNRVGLDGKSRELHIDKAMDTIDFDGVHSKEVVEGTSVDLGTYTHISYVLNDYFSLEGIENHGITVLDRSAEFEIYMVSKGAGSISGAFKTVSVRAGDTFMIPSSLDSYELNGEMTLIKTYVPESVEKVRSVLEAEGMVLSH